MEKNKLLQIASRDEIVSYIRKKFCRIDRASAISLAMIILQGEKPEIEVKDFKTHYKSFVRKNKSMFTEQENNRGKTQYFLNQDIVSKLETDIQNLMDEIGSSIKDIDDDDKDKWTKSRVDGADFYEVNSHTTFQDIREKIDNEGKEVVFKYNFDKNDSNHNDSNHDDLKPDVFYNKTSLQMVDIHVNDNGEYFGMPLKYTYLCPECGNLTTKREYEVSSTQNKIKCEHQIEKVDNKGEVNFKRCNHPLSPDNNQTETKDCYIHSVTFVGHDGEPQKADAISFYALPPGELRVVLQKLPRAYGQQFVHIVDHQPLNREKLHLPEKNQNEHYIFTLVRAVDDYIEKQTNYKHFGFLPMKLAMIIQYISRYMKCFKNDFHIAMTGDRSSGKSQFAKYWGTALYAEKMWASNATSISIPKLRGTMETLHLFGSEHRYQYKGLFGTKDLLVIDEVKENPDVFQNLKQYLLETVYEYSKQGSNNQVYLRTSQVIISQNVDTKHLDKYSKEIKKLYMSDEVGPVRNDDEPKPAWDENVDLGLQLQAYDNKYLRYCIRKIRNMYERNQINWIDGTEKALKDRFFFYFFLSSEKTNEELTQTIRENNSKDIISDNIQLVRLFDSSEFAEYYSQMTHLVNGQNDMEYFKKIDKLLDEYDKGSNARTREMCYTAIKILRIIEGRDYCTEQDMKILQFLIENIDNKIQVTDTNNFNVYGAQDVDDDSDIDENIASTDDDWGYESDLESFKS